VPAKRKGRAGPAPKKKKGEGRACRSSYCPVRKNRKIADPSKGEADCPAWPRKEKEGGGGEGPEPLRRPEKRKNRFSPTRGKKGGRTARPDDWRQKKERRSSRRRWVRKGRDARLLVGKKKGKVFPDPKGEERLRLLSPAPPGGRKKKKRFHFFLEENGKRKEDLAVRRSPFFAGEERRGDSKRKTSQKEINFLPKKKEETRFKKRADVLLFFFISTKGGVITA